MPEAITGDLVDEATTPIAEARQPITAELLEPGTRPEPAELEPHRPDLDAGNATTVALATGGSTVPGTDLPIVPGDRELANLAQMAVTLAAADIVPRALRGKANDVLLVLLTARDLGVALTTAIREFHVIEGKVTLSPKVKLAMVRNAGGNVFPHQPPREVLIRGKAKRLVCPCGDEGPGNGPAGATWHAERTDSPGILYSSTYTLEEAPAELKRKDNWRNYPGRMVSWRALGYLLDDVYPEVGTGLYSPDELGAVTDEQGEPVIDVIGSASPLPGTKAPASHRPPPPAEEAADPAAIAELEDLITRLPADLRDLMRDRWKAAELPAPARLAARQVARARAMVDAHVRDAGDRMTPPAGEEPQDGPEPAAEEPAGPEEPNGPSPAEEPTDLEVAGEEVTTTVIDEVAPFTEADADKVLETVGETAADIATRLLTDAGLAPEAEPDEPVATGGPATRAAIVAEVAALRASTVRDEVLEAGLKLPANPSAARSLLIAARCIEAGVGTDAEGTAITEALK